jgi:uncharacterized LabA/DUF88 family protein
VSTKETFWDSQVIILVSQDSRFYDALSAAKQHALEMRVDNGWKSQYSQYRSKYPTQQSKENSQNKADKKYKDLFSPDR